MIFSIGLGMYLICSFFEVDSEDFTLQDGGIIVGILMMAYSVSNFALGHML